MLARRVCRQDKVVSLIIRTTVYVVYVTCVLELVVSSCNICFITTVTELFDTVCKVALVVTRGGRRSPKLNYNNYNGGTGGCYERISGDYE